MKGKQTSARAQRDPSGTIKRILAAARVEFGANGFDGAKVEHIARRAKVSKQLVYFYFNGKEDLYGELAREMSRNAYERLLAIDFGQPDGEAAIRTYIEGVYDLFLDDPVIGVVAIDQSLHDGAHVRMPNEIRRMQEQLRERMGEALERGREAGTFGGHVDTDGLEFMTTIIVSGCVSSRSMFERFGGHGVDQDSAFWREYAVTFILRALRA